MNIHSQAEMARLREAWRVIVVKAATEGAAPVSDMICQIERSNRESNVYDAVFQLPTMDRFKDRVPDSNMASVQFRIKNDQFASQVTVRQEDVERDELGKYGNMFAMLGVGARRCTDRVLGQVLQSSFTTNDYTGTAFFAADKPHIPGVIESGTFSNKMTNKPSAASWEAAKLLMANIKDANGEPMGIGAKKLVVCSAKWTSTFRRILNAELISQVTTGEGVAAVSNIYKGDADILEFAQLNTAARQDMWFVLDVGWPLRAFIDQRETDIQFYAQDNPNVHKDAFEKHVFKYQAYRRGEVGFGLPQFAVGSTGADNPL